MKFPAEVKKCVVFIALQKANGDYVLVGTGFFIQKILDDKALAFLVTAKHVIEGIDDLMLDFVYVRVNTLDGYSRWYSTEVKDWHFHEDETVDVAVVNLLWEADWDHLLYLGTAAMTEKQIKDYEIDVGDEVFIVGLFKHHEGKHRNIPIARIGNIAAMPEEKIRAKKDLIDAYLVEVRSIGGLSGSPVFINLRTPRVTNDRLVNNNAGYSHLLMGLVHGHFDEVQLSKDNEETERIKQEINRVNMGIAMVIPVEKIMEAIDALAEFNFKKT